MINYTDYICGDKFVKLADYVYADGTRPPNTSCIVYCDSDQIEKCFEVLCLNKQHQYILITHNSDRNIEQDLVNNRPGNIHHWFAQNANAISSGFEGIPIGISNPKWGDLGSIKQVEDASTIEKPPTRLIYFGGKLETNTTKRGPWSVHLQQAFNPNEQHHHFSRIPRHSFLQECMASKFILSPPGNGIDCHRTWEALYLGRVPIVERSNAMSYFTALPILFYDKPTDITRSVLEANYHLVKNFWDFDLRRLTMTYWADKIKRKFKEIRFEK